MKVLSQILDRLWKIAISLRLAVTVIVGLAIALAAGTIYESLYDLKTAWYFVYDTLWFKGILVLLGVNILCVALSRWPWKKRHTPFLLAHAGILLILFGSFLTQKIGIDALMTIKEGQKQSFIEIDELRLAIREGKNISSVKLKWTPPNGSFRRVKVSKYNFAIEEFLAHADAKYSFEKPEAPSEKPKGIALHFRLKGGPLQISRDFWLWTGAIEWNSISLGPAKFALLPQGSGPWSKKTFLKGQMGMLEFRPSEDGGLEYRSATASGKEKLGKIAASEIEGAEFELGWMGMRAKIHKLEEGAVNKSYYAPARVLYGDQAPPSAIRIRKLDSDSDTDDIWLGEGDSAKYYFEGKVIDLVYYKRRQQIPFGLRLERFQIDKYLGTNNPMAFSSKVRVVDKTKVSQPLTISMNEPLDYKGFTVYQSSYVPGEPRPTISVFTVNKDPGRWWKYVGSILLVLGSIILFAVKYTKIKWVKKWLT